MRKKYFKQTMLVLMLLFYSFSEGQTLLHYWNFNNNASVSAITTPTQTNLVGASLIATISGISVVDFAGGTGQNFNLLNLNARNSDAFGTHLRFNDPIGSSLVFSLPTTGYENAIIKFATRRSAQGAGTQVWSYSTDGTTYTFFANVLPNNGDPGLATLDLSSISAVDNNPNFKLKVVFLQGAGGTSGNNRFDNFTAEGSLIVSADTTAPTATFFPVNAATNMVRTVNPAITFNENVRLLTNDAISNTNVDAVVEVRLNNASGDLVPFDATFASNKITIVPTTAFFTNQVYYVAILPNTIEDESNNAVTTLQSTVFTTAKPTVTLSVNANTGTEAGTTSITVSATADAAVSGDQTVNLGVTGTNITAGDYSLNNSVITILNGQTTGSVTFTVVDDILAEGSETATLTISNPSSGLTFGATLTQNVVITDNDLATNPIVTISVSANTGTEAGTTAIAITATANAAVSGDQTLNLGVSGTNITAGDYSLSNSVITILNGQTTSSVTFTVIDDALSEGSEVAALTITNPSAGIVIGTTNTQSVTITDNDVALNIDLSTYVRVGRYSLPEPTRTAHPINNLLAQEVSAVTYNWDTNTLFVVGDGSTAIVQVSKTGELIDSMTLAQGSSPQGTEFYDTEGLTYIGNGQFVMTEERDRQLVKFTYVAGTTLARTNTQTVKLGTFVDNTGAEGLTYDPLTKGYVVLKEVTPIGIFQTGIDFNAGTATNGSATTVNSVNLFDPALLNFSDVADIFALSNLPSLNGQSLYNNLLVLSQEAAKVVNIDRNGVISSTLTIVSDAGNPLDVASQQHEGLTMDRDGILYITSENGGGDIDHPQLWVYAPSTTPNQAPTVVALTNTTNAILENSNTTAAVKVADISVTDDGLGTNNLTLSGTDANFFQITGSSLYIKAGTVLDYETKTSYNVTVNVDDSSKGTSPDASANYALAVTDVAVETIAVVAVSISEVASWSSSSLVAADWFEVTNNGTQALDITGWKVDDSSNLFTSALALNGITSIAAGESVIFLETSSTNAATIIANFKSAWFGSNVPVNLQVGSYTGAAIGLSSSSDAVNLYDTSGVVKANVTFGVATTNYTFNNAAGLTNTAITTLSQVGVNDAFAAANDANQIGSPGSVGKLFISEVAPWSSSNSPIAVDWFEITNTKAVAVDITGWKMDDNSQSPAGAVALSGITSINPGESVIFMETGDLAGKTAAFLNNWFGPNPTSGIRIGNYTGSGVGLGSGGDQVNLYNATSSTPQTSVLFGASPTTTFATFDNSAGLNSLTSAIAQLSAVGTKGAFTAANSATEIGSPGTIITVACPTITATATSALASVCSGATTTVSVNATGGTLPYIVSGSPLTVGGGTFNYTVTDAKGCTATTSVTITNQPLTDNITLVTACDKYTWNGTEYTASGLYTGTTTNCVTEKLNLTITPSSNHTTTITACDSYSWNGTTYTSSGLYTGTTTNCVTEKLNLTITPNSVHTTTINACDSYTWNGSTYNTSGLYTGTTTNCVTEKLNLTITPSSINITLVTACDRYTWNENEYTTSGLYTGTTTNCVTEKLDLTINSNSITSQPNNASICKVIGGTATLAVGTSASSATYKWYTQSSTTATTGTWSLVANNANYSGATTATLIITKTEKTLPAAGSKYKAVITNSCGTITSDIVVIADLTVLSKAAAISAKSSTNVTLSPALTTCSGNAVNLTLAAGSVGNIQWQMSTTSATTGFAAFGSSIVQSAVSVLNPLMTISSGVLSQDTWFRAVAFNGICSSVIGVAIKISVSVPAVAGTISGGDVTVCAFSTAALNLMGALIPFTNSTELNLVGNTGAIVWQKSANYNAASPIWSVAGSTASTLNIANLTADTWYRALVTNGACKVFSDVVKITTSKVAKAGATTATTNGASTTSVCAGGDITFASAEYTGTSIQWEVSTTSSTTGFVNVDGATGNSFTMTNVTYAPLSKFYVRSVVTSGDCTLARSEIKTIMVNPMSVSGTVTGGGAICSGSNGTVKVAGNTGAIQWQSSADGINYVNVSVGLATAGTNYVSGSATGIAATFLITTITADTYFRAKITSGACSESYSNSIQYIVGTAAVSGSSTAANTMICSGTGTTVKLVGYVGAVKWFKSTNWTAATPIWTAVTTTTSAALATGNLTASTAYKAEVTIGSCSGGRSTSGIATVMVNSVPLAKTITANVTSPTGATSALAICTSVAKTLTIGSGSIGAIQWQKSTTSTTLGFTDIRDATSTSYTITNPAAGVNYFRARFTNSCGVSVYGAAFPMYYRNCTSAKIASPKEQVKANFDVFAYPNPFNDNFTISLESPSEEKVNVKVFDMSGKLIDQREVIYSEVSTLHLGDDYTSGVYNVIVTQGTNVITLRVVKQ